jgi:hypothetical protein
MNNEEITHPNSRKFQNDILGSFPLQALNNPNLHRSLSLSFDNKALSKLVIGSAILYSSVPTRLLRLTPCYVISTLNVSFETSLLGTLANNPPKKPHRQRRNINLCGSDKEVLGVVFWTWMEDEWGSAAIQDRDDIAFLLTGGKPLP